MNLGRRVKALVLAGIMALSCAVIEDLILNTNEADNKVRQGILSEWMGISRARAEDVESLEEIVEKDPLEEKEQSVEEVKEIDGKKVLSFPERYPDFAEYYYDGFDQEIFDLHLEGTIGFYERTARFVYEKEVVDSNGETCTIQVLGVSKREGKNFPGWELKGPYIFNPDDCVYYTRVTDEGDVLLLSTNDIGTIGKNPPGSQYGDMLLLHVMEMKMSPNDVQNIIDQVSSGLVVQDLDYEGKDLSVNDGPVL